MYKLLVPLSTEYGLSPHKHGTLAVKYTLFADELLTFLCDINGQDLEDLVFPLSGEGWRLTGEYHHTKSFLTFRGVAPDEAKFILEIDDLSLAMQLKLQFGLQEHVEK
jgi:hypothetical protein